jgi:hypothetical protein
MSFERDRAKPFGRRTSVAENTEPPTKTPDEAPVDVAGSSPSAVASAPVDRTKSPIFVLERFAEAMQVIKSYAMALAAAVRSNVRHEGALPPDVIYWPIRWKDCEKLFEHTDQSGRTLYATFCFTNDCLNFSPIAQYELNRLYRLVLDTNMLSHGQLLFGLPPGSLQELKTQLDAIVVKSMQFCELAKSYPLVVDIMEGRIRGQAKIDAINAQIRMQRAELSKLPMLLFDPEKAGKFLPNPDTCFFAAYSEPYHEGQMFLNGVFFKREYAEPMLADIAKRREAMAEIEGKTRH